MSYALAWLAMFNIFLFAPRRSNTGTIGNVCC